MDHVQPTRVDPRKQALLEARFGGQHKVCGSEGEALGLDPVHGGSLPASGVPRGDNSGGSNNSHSSSAHFKQYASSPLKASNPPGTTILPAFRLTFCHHD